MTFNWSEIQATLLGPFSAFVVVLIGCYQLYKMFVKGDAALEKSQQVIMDMQSQRILALETRQHAMEMESRECHSTNLKLAQQNTELALKVAVLTEQLGKLSAEMLSIKAQIA